MTYMIGAAVDAKVGRKRNSGAKAEEDAQSIEGDINHGDAELVDEGGREEVEEGKEPPRAYEERVIDNGGGAGDCASDVVAHEGSDKNGADELRTVKHSF